ncbi:MAG: hypothetical protein HY835_14000 [Anaerolineae bacterium]|nr:hypothetical protein [Anaerolineae bacterium]
MRDLRAYSRQTTFRLIAGGLILLFVVGIGLIYFIYGPSAAISGMICLGIGLVPILLIILALAIIEWIAKRADRN